MSKQIKEKNNNKEIKQHTKISKQAEIKVVDEPVVKKIPTRYAKDYKRRFDLYGKELYENYKSIYGNRENVEEKYKVLLESMYEAYKGRKKELKVLDNKREKDTTWFLSQNKVGYMMYVDLFCKDLEGLKEKIDYLKELNITYLHIMPLLKMPKEHNDGGYAVSCYKTIDERFGDMGQFEKILDMFRKEGISVCLDFVINHTSKEHEWAMKAREGSKEYQDMYFMYEHYDIPAQFEETVPEVFPKVSPGNFTYYPEMNRHVFTSFYEFQWDLNYQNPVVFNKIAENILELANRGVEIFRIDAVPFMWKELGTKCRNLPQIHTLVQMYKLITKIVCPSIILKGEAIVKPDEILSYFGGIEGKECHTMYNASMMTLLWNSIATKDVRIMTESLKRNPQIPKEATWINYIRCHDDIGWGFDEDVVEHFASHPFHHKQFIINFFKGNHPNSFAKGQLYEFDEATMDARTSGTLASLCGLEKALEDQNTHEIWLSQRRILLLNSMILAYSGIPVLYSGDEIAQLNDYRYQSNQAKKSDSRWLHRQNFDWRIAENRNDTSTIEGNVFTGIKKRIQIRNDYEIFRSDVLSTPLYTNNDSVFSFFKRSENEELVVLANFSEHYQAINLDEIHSNGLFGGFVELIEGHETTLDCNQFGLAAYECKWLYKKF